MKRKNNNQFLEKNKKLTSFQKRVYTAVLSIPKGEVRSYAWVAGKIRSPRAFRAVGTALNKNPCIGIIPCHRVIRSDGRVGGFYQGVSVKKNILKHEGLDFK